MSISNYAIFFVIAIVIGGAIAMVGVTGRSSDTAPEPMPPPPKVSVASVVVKEVKPWDAFTGRIEAVESVELRPRVSGSLERVNLVEGNEVTKGDVLFVIDQRPYQAALDRARADLARAQAQTALARKELARAEKLAGSRTISAEELDRSQATVAQAEANAHAARADVEMAELDLEFTEVRAPISGRAGRALVTAGNLVSSQGEATLLTTIVSLDPVYVTFEHDEQTYLRYAAMSRNGERQSAREARHPVRVALAGEAGYPHTGEMDFLDNKVDPATGTIRARAVLPNPGRLLVPGLFARVQLLAGDTFEALLIDDKAVLTDQDRQYVYVVGEGGRAQRKDVQLGRLVDSLRVVRSGLQPQDRVIVHGVQKVFAPGMPVEAQTVAMGNPPPAPQTAGAN